MAVSIENELGIVRLLGLGNEILADDAFGILAAREVARRFQGQIEVVQSSSAGYDLMDHLLGPASVSSGYHCYRPRQARRDLRLHRRPCTTRTGRLSSLFGALRSAGGGQKTASGCAKGNHCDRGGGFRLYNRRRPHPPRCAIGDSRGGGTGGRFLANGTLEIPEVWEQ